MKKETYGTGRGNRRVHGLRPVTKLLLISLALMGHIFSIALAETRDAPPVRTSPKMGSPSDMGDHSAGAPEPLAPVPLSSLFPLLNCICGSCDETLANCGCGRARDLRDEVAFLWRAQGLDKPVLEEMVQRYGRKVLSNEGLSRMPPRPGKKQPSIQVEPSSYDFGTIPQRPVTQRFVVRNVGEETLVIKQMTTSCGCTTATLNPKSIPPGGKATLTVRFDPELHDTEGRVTRTVSIESNDPLHPLVKIRLHAFIYKEKEAKANLPAFAYNSAETLQGYRIATQIPGVLEKIPCFCGCGKESQHRNLKDCFFRADGSFDEHGSGCNVCDREAIDVKKWLRKGLSMEEIRNRIEEKYRNYGDPTPTPPI